MNVQSNLDDQSQRLNSISNSNAIKNGCIKSIQRGTKTAALGSVTININPVDIEKAFLIVEADFGSLSQNSNIQWSMYSTLVNSTTIKVQNLSSSSSRSVCISWQVIEFY